MTHGWPLLLRLLLICLALPSVAGAVSAPEKMIRIVAREVSPGVAAESFRAQPKTLYRLGTRYGRVEELPNPASGLHLLAVMNEPDVWMVNRRDGTGRHIIDPDPSFHVGAPVFEWPGLPATLADLEHGCERASGFRNEMGLFVGSIFPGASHDARYCSGFRGTNVSRRDSGSFRAPLDCGDFAGVV